VSHAARSVLACGPYGDPLTGRPGRRHADAVRSVASSPRTLGALVRSSEPTALARVRDALALQGGAIAPAAAVLGVSRRTLTEWLRLPSLRDVQTLGRVGAANRARAASRKGR
jgi:DNA-binding NtrC family response regulator